MVCSTAWKMKVELYTFRSFLLDENASQSNPWAAGMFGSSLATWPSFLTVGLRKGLTLRSWIYIKYILCTFYHFFFNYYFLHVPSVEGTEDTTAMSCFRIQARAGLL